ncbi:UNVERIFIED_CONTAM: hypothetical protein K2H54_037381 [Gekko kuhli]
MEADGGQAISGSPNDSQHDPGKMFIGGLSWQTSPDNLRDYFSKFGDIRECMVMRDPTTKRSRGFGFVTFADPASVDKVLAQPHHELDSKTLTGNCNRLILKLHFPDELNLRAGDEAWASVEALTKHQVNNGSICSHQERGISQRTLEWSLICFRICCLEKGVELERCAP